MKTWQPTKIEGRSGPGSVCWRVGLLEAFRRDRFSSKGESMCTVNAAAVEPSGREEVSGVACLKLWSARALLKRESERGSDRPEKANCRPGVFGQACLRAGSGRFGRATWPVAPQIDQRRRAVNPACFEVCLKPGLAQASGRALLSLTREGQRSTQPVLKGLFGSATQAISLGGMFTVNCVAVGLPSVWHV